MVLRIVRINIVCAQTSHFVVVLKNTKSGS